MQEKEVMLSRSRGGRPAYLLEDVTHWKQFIADLFKLWNEKNWFIILIFYLTHQTSIPN